MRPNGTFSNRQEYDLHFKQTKENLDNELQATTDITNVDIAQKSILRKFK
jgi:hypothetical protein